MSVTCRRQDQARFIDLGFRVDYDDDPSQPIVELVDEEANYAHCNQLPANLPFKARNGAGGAYGDALIVCDGKTTVELPTSQDGSLVVDWNYRFGLPTLQSILRIRRYLSLERRVDKLFRELRANHQPSLPFKSRQRSH